MAENIIMPLINGQIFLPSIFISAFVFIFQRFFFDGKNISQTQDINPELGTLGHILVTAIIFSVAAVRKNNAAGAKRGKGN